MEIRLLPLVLVLCALWACNPGEKNDFPGLKYHEPAEGPHPAAAFNSQQGRSAEWSFGELPGYSVIRFDVRKYEGWDSLIFRTDIYSTDRSARCFVRLYNLTDGEPIPFSEVNRRVGVTRSDNLMGAFPPKEIELGIQIRSEKDGALVGIRDYSFLYAYKTFR